MRAGNGSGMENCQARLAGSPPEGTIWELLSGGTFRAMNASPPLGRLL